MTVLRHLCAPAFAAILAVTFASPSRAGLGPELRLNEPTYSFAEGNQSAPRIAFGGSEYLAVWNDHSSGLRSGVGAARVSPSGSVLDTPSLAFGRGGVASAVTYDGQRFVVVWTDQSC